MVTPDSETLLLLLFSNYVYLKDRPGIFFSGDFIQNPKQTWILVRKINFISLFWLFFFLFLSQA